MHGWFCSCLFLEKRCSWLLEVRWPGAAKKRKTIEKAESNRGRTSKQDNYSSQRIFKQFVELGLVGRERCFFCKFRDESSQMYSRVRVWVQSKKPTSGLKWFGIRAPTLRGFSQNCSVVTWRIGGFVGARSTGCY